MVAARRRPAVRADWPQRVVAHAVARGQKDRATWWRRRAAAVPDVPGSVVFTGRPLGRVFDGRGNNAAERLRPTVSRDWPAIPDRQRRAQSCMVTRRQGTLLYAVWWSAEQAERCHAHHTADVWGSSSGDV